MHKNFQKPPPGDYHALMSLYFQLDVIQIMVLVCKSCYKYTWIATIHVQSFECSLWFAVLDLYALLIQMLQHGEYSNSLL